MNDNKILTVTDPILVLALRLLATDLSKIYRSIWWITGAVGDVKTTSLWVNLREVRSAWSRHLILVASRAPGTADAILQSGAVYNLRLLKSQMGS